MHNSGIKLLATGCGLWTNRFQTYIFHQWPSITSCRLPTEQHPHLFSAPRLDPCLHPAFHVWKAGETESGHGQGPAGRGSLTLQKVLPLCLQILVFYLALCHHSPPSRVWGRHRELESDRAGKEEQGGERLLIYKAWNSSCEWVFALIP